MILADNLFRRPAPLVFFHTRRALSVRVSNCKTNSEISTTVLSDVRNNNTCKNITGRERLERIEETGAVEIVGQQVVGRINVNATDQRHGIRAVAVRVRRIVRRHVSPFTAGIDFLQTIIVIYYTARS